MLNNTMNLISLAEKTEKANEGWTWDKLTSLDGWSNISSVIGDIANVAVLVITWGFALYFIVKLLYATFRYFQAKKDPRKKEEAKEEVQSMATGLVVVVIGKYVLKFALSLLGFGTNLVPAWLSLMFPFFF